MYVIFFLVLVFFFNDTATTEIYTLSLHDALPICVATRGPVRPSSFETTPGSGIADRKSTRLNSSHDQISYAVFCLKKKKSPRHAWTLTTLQQRKSKSIHHNNTK